MATSTSCSLRTGRCRRSWRRWPGSAPSCSHVTKTNALESLVIASFIRGLSVRDVEATLAEALGDQAATSKSTVSAVCQQINQGRVPGVGAAPPR